LSVSYDFSPEDRLCVLRLSGVVTVDEMVGNVRSALADPQWSVKYRFLSVMTDVILTDISADLTSAMVRKLAELDAPLPGGKPMRCAVACSDEVANALMVYYEYRSKSERLTDERFFRTEAEARAWLASPDEN
jgi:hypothetical protein